MTTVPLDPASPAGIAAAERFSQALAEIKLAIWGRRAAAEAAVPRPSAPPRPKPSPSPRPSKEVTA